MEHQYQKGAYKGSLSDLAEQMGLPYLGELIGQVDPSLFAILPAETAERLNVLPLEQANGMLKVAVADPLDMSLEAKLATITGQRIDLVVADPALIRTALKRSESSQKVLDSVSSDFRVQIVTESDEGKRETLDIETIQDQTGVVRLANSIIVSALRRRASDIHIEAFDGRVDLKYRIDGVLVPATDPLDRAVHGELVNRIKVMADLDISERRIPQDGRFRLAVDGRDIDFRVSILPTQFGEDVVIRVLDKNALVKLGQKLDLTVLGVGEAEAAQIRRAVHEPNGLILMTGPTGSGKTTTLYGAVSELVTGEEKLITIEDPVEYQLDGVVQIAVNEKKGMTFGAGLRSILRHDPDRIMVGEIRDLETAAISVQAALTGHLVLASVHANSSFDVISRFTHWGVDVHDLVAALNAVFAQRLIRNLCPNCAEPDPDNPGHKRAKGCSSCSHTGYHGRSAILEHLEITPEIAELIAARAPAMSVRKAALATGMTTLADAARARAADGLTSLEEVRRVTGLD